MSIKYLFKQTKKTKKYPTTLKFGPNSYRHFKYLFLNCRRKNMYLIIGLPQVENIFLINIFFFFCGGLEEKYRRSAKEYKQSSININNNEIRSNNK